MTDAFDPKKADFSGIAPQPPPLWIAGVLHQACGEVNEEGTEAAAATALTAPEAAPPGADEPLVFRADHPFLFLLRDRRSGSILFLGRLMDPKHS
jgi:serpin B